MGGLNKREHVYWYPRLSSKFTETCSLCFKTPLVASDNDKYVHRLLIHEIKYERPLKEENLMLLCDSCNQKVHPPKPIKSKREMTPEMEQAFRKEPIAREYILHRIKYDGPQEWDELINSAAEKAGCSTKAAKTYLLKLTSTEGPLIDQYDGSNTKVYEKGKQPELKFDIEQGRFVPIKRS